MTDDPKRPRRAMSQTDRDMEGLSRLRAERVARVEAARKKQEDGAVQDELPAIDTGMTERIAEDPDLHRLFTKIEHARREAVQELARSRREAADLLLEVAGEKPPDERFAVVEKRLKFAYWILSAILIPVIMSLVLAAKYVYTRGGRDAKIEMQNAALIEDVAELKRQNIAQGAQLSEATELARRNAQRIDDLLRRRAEQPAPTRSPARGQPRTVTPSPVSPPTPTP